MRYLLILLLLSGCAIPIKITTYTSPEELTIQKKIRNHEIRKEKYAKIYDKAMKRLNRKIAQKEKMKPKPTLKPKPKKLSFKTTFIQAIMVESGLSEPDTTILWERYKRSGIKGFARYLIKTNYFERLTGHGVRDDVYIDFVERLKVQTKMLKKK